MDLCLGDGCMNPARRAGLCGRCLKRRTRGQQLRTPDRLSPKERAMNCVFEWLEADAEDDRTYERLERRFFDACDALYLASGWTPPARRSTGEG
jgi:hypothetical protein